MMQCTDIHDRYLMRLITKKSFLYTEMVTTGAIIHGNATHQLDFNKSIESPVALQLGGSNPDELAKCSEIAESMGYDEINLNLGCPSERVQKGSFGACLMIEPKLVQRCLNAMKQSVSIPVTAKCRTGIDKIEDYDFLRSFVEGIANQNIATGTQGLASGLLNLNSSFKTPINQNMQTRMPVQPISNLSARGLQDVGTNYNPLMQNLI